jgi:hypothetical protein
VARPAVIFPLTASSIELDLRKKEVKDHEDFESMD